MSCVAFGPNLLFKPTVAKATNVFTYHLKPIYLEVARDKTFEIGKIKRLLLLLIGHKSEGHGNYDSAARPERVLGSLQQTLRVELLLQHIA
jgi:hypothetical protein